MSTMKLWPTIIFASFATPALAAGDKPFFSLFNTDFADTIGFILFFSVIFYLKVPGLLGGLLDKRADGLQAELDEARAIRAGAQALLAGFERKQKEVQEQAERIVASAKEEATNAAAAAKDDIAASITRRLAAAEEQIASAQASAVKDVRDQAIAVAVGAAKDLMAKQMDAKSAGTLIDESIATVGEKLH